MLQTNTALWHTAVTSSLLFQAAACAKWLNTSCRIAKYLITYLSWSVPECNLTLYFSLLTVPVSKVTPHPSNVPLSPVLPFSGFPSFASGAVWGHDEAVLCATGAVQQQSNHPAHPHVMLSKPSATGDFWSSFPTKHTAQSPCTMNAVSHLQNIDVLLSIWVFFFFRTILTEIIDSISPISL